LTGFRKPGFRALKREKRAAAANSSKISKKQAFSRSPHPVYFQKPARAAIDNHNK
jgi:hypothetical protein